MDENKFDVQNLTNTLINIKWGLKVVWCLLTPKNANSKSKIQKIACASVYCKPSTNYKTDLHDHIAEAYNLLSTNLSQSLCQIVKKPTRTDPVTGVERILDPVITS